MHKIYFKNFIATAVMVLASFLLIAFAFGFVSRSVFISETRATMLTNARELSRTASTYAQSRDLRSLELRMHLTSVAAINNEHIFLVSGSGYVVNCSDANILCPHVGMRLDPGVIDAVVKDETASFLGTLGGFYGEEHYVVATALTAFDGTPLGYLFVAKETGAVLDMWKTITPLFLLICAAVLLLSLILSFAVSRHMAKPLKSMAEVARRFGRGELSARAEGAERLDEIGELADAFNSMADSLEKSEQRRSEFIANVSHELKTPMTTISGFADGILDGTIAPEDQDHYLQIISSETKRLSRLVRSMLGLSRLQSEDRTSLLQKSFDIAEVLRLTIISFADKIDGKHLDVDFQVPEDAMFVRGDADAITQVVYNLLDNAIKFSPEGTTLSLSLWKDDEKAYVSVRNHGETIPEDEIPLLFDRFHKADKSRSQNRDGVGLGLYIVQTILHNHGEDIAVTSRDGVTDFVFTLSLKT